MLKLTVNIATNEPNKIDAETYYAFGKSTHRLPFVCYAILGLEPLSASTECAMASKIRKTFWNTRN